MGGINQISKEVVTFHLSRVSLTLTWKSESLVTKTLRSSNAYGHVFF